MPSYYCSLVVLGPGGTAVELYAVKFSREEEEEQQQKLDAVINKAI